MGFAMDQQAASRKARILQVRAQEKKFSSQQVKRFLEKKRREQQAVMRQLKEAWEEDHQNRIAELEQQCSIALNSIGSSHTAAALLMSNKISHAKILEKYVQENHSLELLRYKQALQEEHSRREQAELSQRLANKRKKTKEVAACLERSIARFAAHTMGTDWKRRKCVTSADHACREPFSPIKPGSYKYTFLHSSSAFAKSRPNPVIADMDAWEAADLQRQALEYHKALQGEISEILRRRVVLRGQAAASRILMEKRIQELERALEMVQRSERERKQRHLLDQDEKCVGEQNGEADKAQNLQQEEAHEDVRLDNTSGSHADNGFAAVQRPETSGNIEEHNPQKGSTESKKDAGKQVASMVKASEVQIGSVTKKVKTSILAREPRLEDVVNGKGIPPHPTNLRRGKNATRELKHKQAKEKKAPTETRLEDAICLSRALKDKTPDQAGRKCVSKPPRASARKENRNVQAGIRKRQGTKKHMNAELEKACDRLAIASLCPSATVGEWSYSIGPCQEKKIQGYTRGWR